MRKDFEDHLQSWYGLVVCGVLSTTIGAYTLLFGFDTFWQDGAGERMELVIYLLGFGAIAMLAGACAFSWAAVKIVIQIVHWVKKLSSQK